MTTSWDKREGDDSVLNSVSTAGIALEATTTDTIYVLLALRLKPGHTAGITRPVRFSIINKGMSHFEWMLLVNPTIAAALIWQTSHGHSDIEFARGTTVHTIAEGDWDASPDSGFVRTSQPGGGGQHNDVIDQPIGLTNDPFVLAVRPLISGATMRGTLVTREAT